MGRGPGRRGDPVHSPRLCCSLLWRRPQRRLRAAAGSGPSPHTPRGRHHAVSSLTKPWSGCSLEGKECPSRPAGAGHCLAFFTMVPTAEMTVVLEPLALVVTVTTAGRVAVVVRMVGWAMVVTGMAESHLLFLF